LFVNDYSFKKDDALNFLNETAEQTILEKYKKILYTGSFDKSYINKLSFSNINGILHKQDTPLFIEQNRNITNLPTLKQAKERFIKILKFVNEGCTFFDRKITNMLPRRYAWASGSDDFVSKTSPLKEKQIEEVGYLINSLTPREREILSLISQGKQNKEIANKLYIAIGTVEQHKIHIIKKLNLKNTKELINIAINNKHYII